MDRTEIHETIRRLERENRRIKLGGLAALLGIVLIAAAGAQRAEVQRVVEAEQFVLRDRAGTERASLCVLETGSSLLTLRDQLGTRRAILSVGAEGNPAISLYGDKGKFSAYLGIMQGQPSLVLREEGQDSRVEIRQRSLTLLDSSNVARASLSLLGNGTPVMSFHDEKGKQRASLVLFKKGSPALSFDDADGKTCVRLTEGNGLPNLTLGGVGNSSEIVLSAQERGTMMSLKARDRKFGLLLGTSDHGESRIIFNATDGKPRLGMGVSRGGVPQLKMLDEDGNTQFQALKEVDPLPEK